LGIYVYIYTHTPYMTQQVNYITSVQHQLKCIVTG